MPIYPDYTRDPVLVVASIDPAVRAPGLYSSAWLSAWGLRQVVAILSTGTLSEGASVRAWIERSAHEDGSNPEAYPDTRTDFLEAGVGNDRQAIVEFACVGHFRLVVEIEGAEVFASALVLGQPNCFSLAHAASVAQRVDPRHPPVVR